MAYVLEDQREFERLERQSSTEGYDFKAELSQIRFSETGTFLDAGCGSGIVTRYLAETYPSAKIVGLDFSTDRVGQAQKASDACGLKNTRFEEADLRSTRQPGGHFDVAVCRFALEYLSEGDQLCCARELFRTLKPGGQAVLIDIDGYLFNVHPKTRLTKELQTAFEAQPPVDIWTGRKLPSLLERAGFESVQWKIETMQFNTPEALKMESQLIAERFAQSVPTYAKLLGSEKRAKEFQAEYLEALSKPGTSLFYNKFVAWGCKPRLKLAE